MSERIELNWGGTTIRVVADQVDFYKNLGYKEAPKPRTTRTKPKAGDE